jgi:hypothetical protein
MSPIVIDDLSQAIKLLGVEAFEIRVEFRESPTHFKKKTVSNLEEPDGWSIFGAVYLRNLQKILLGQSTRTVEIRADECIAIIIPKRRRWTFWKRPEIYARIIDESEASLASPSDNDKEEYEISNFAISDWAYGKHYCWEKVEYAVRKYGLKMPFVRGFSNPFGEL